VARRYGVTNLPTLVAIGADGKIIEVRSGFKDENDIEELATRAMLDQAL